MFLYHHLLKVINYLALISYSSKYFAKKKKFIYLFIFKQFKYEKVKQQVKKPSQFKTKGLKYTRYLCESNMCIN